MGMDGSRSKWVVLIEEREQQTQDEPGPDTHRAHVFVRESGRARLVAVIDGSPRFLTPASRFALIRELGSDAAWDLFCATLRDAEGSGL